MISRSTAPTPPPDLFGKSGADRFLRGLTSFNDFYLRMMDRSLWRGSNPEPPVWAPPALHELVVAARTVECDGVVALRLAAPDCGPLARWQPGSHLRVELPSGRIRHYSLCGDPADQYAYVIAVRRIEGGGGGSVEIHDQLQQGTMIRAMAPRNAFPFAAEPAVLFIAGGIGITPILPMVREAAARKLNWHLVHTGRSRASLPFADQARSLDPARVEILPGDETGPPDCADLLSRAPKGAAVYCCGPAPMLEGVRAAADQAGGEAIRAFHFERFTAAPIANGQTFELELSRGESAEDRTVLTVPPDRSVLDVLRDHDPATPYSCRQGFCGVCRQRVVAGHVEHRDLRLTDQERANGDMLVCVSRAPEGERLVLSQ